MRSPFALLLTVAVLGACQSAPPVPDDFPPPGGTYYTQYSLFYERGHHQTTNFRASPEGVLLPINSDVTLGEVSRNGFMLTIMATGEEIEIQHIARHTGDSLMEAFQEICGAEPVDLEQFTAEEQDAIAVGDARVGMSRDAVLAAMGEPPITKTPSLDVRTWIYQKSRFATMKVVFDENWVVTEVVGA